LVLQTRIFDGKGLNGKSERAEISAKNEINVIPRATVLSEDAFGAARTGLLRVTEEDSWKFSGRLLCRVPLSHIYDLEKISDVVSEGQNRKGAIVSVDFFSAFAYVIKNDLGG
jgi:hypothetical protein